jgi:hypothetical protein
MSTHMISDETITPTSVDPSADRAWLRLSAAISDEVPYIADREDLVVTVAPGAGQGHTACFLPAHAHIEINGAYLAPVDPASVTPDRVSDRARYAAVWGALTHECAHAAHSCWEPPADAPHAVVDAAMLLEESRIEAAQIRRRPDDRHWLRACAIDLVLADLFGPEGTTPPRMTPVHAAHTAALMMARVDAGILTTEETAPVASVITTVLGEDTLATLREIWQTAHVTGDDDTDTMIDLGRRWCEAIGVDPERREPETTGESEDGPAEWSPLAAGIARSAGKITRAVRDEPVPADPATITAEKEATERAAAESAATTSDTVFTDWPRKTGDTRIRGTRPPEPAERRAARALARALTTAGIRDRTATKTTSPVPPGRLRMRGALAADAQRAAGTLPTAEPFTRTTRCVAPAPPLRLGIACDVSGSMTAVTRPVASTAWILAHAARHTQVPATSAAVIFGYHVRPITYPGIAPRDVTEFVAEDDAENIGGAIDALDGALGLAHPGAARLLVIVSDGEFHRRDRLAGQTRVNRLRAAGCAVLWLSTRSSDRPLDGVTVHRLTDPTDTAQAIGRAATAALRAAR